MKLWRHALFFLNRRHLAGLPLKCQNFSVKTNWVNQYSLSQQSTIYIIEPSNEDSTLLAKISILVKIWWQMLPDRVGQKSKVKNWPMTYDDRGTKLLCKSEAMVNHNWRLRNWIEWRVRKAARSNITQPTKKRWLTRWWNWLALLLLWSTLLKYCL